MKFNFLGLHFMSSYIRALILDFQNHFMKFDFLGLHLMSSNIRAVISDFLESFCEVQFKWFAFKIILHLHDMELI